MLQALDVARANAAHFDDMQSYWGNMWQPYCGFDDSDCGRDRDSDCGSSGRSSQRLQPMPSLTTMSSCSTDKQNCNYFTGAVEPKEPEMEEPEHLLLQGFRGGISGSICGMSKAKSVKVGKQQQQQQVGTTTTQATAVAVVGATAHQ